MDERLLTESNNGRKISLVAAAWNADSDAIAGLSTIPHLESSDRMQLAAIPAAGGNQSPKISGFSASPTNTVFEDGAGVDSVPVIART